ncbi:MAG: hypothetical protein K2J42_03845 [Muribaculaceae bacterium]|nr:hypothetical protein [Muribaculaceae bacterium]
MLKKTTKTALLSLLTIVWAAAMTSCGDKEEYSDEFTYYDVVIYNGNDADDAVFATVDPATGAKVNYTAPVSIDPEIVKPGECIFLAYTIPDNRSPYQSGVITPTGYSTMTNVKGEIVPPDEIEGWNTTPFYLLSYSSMYNRLIINAGIPYSTTKRKLIVKVDETTLDNEMATAYLYQKLDDTTPTFTREYQMAFDLSEIANRLPGDRLKVMVNNSNLTFDSFIINLDK